MEQSSQAAEAGGRAKGPIWRAIDARDVARPFVDFLPYQTARSPLTIGG
jgi:hypothetical protein